MPEWIVPSRGQKDTGSAVFIDAGPWAVHMVIAMLNLFRLLLVMLVAASCGPLRADEAIPDAELALSAHLETDADTTIIHDGLIWRVYADPTDGTPARFVTQSDNATPTFQLPPGAYIVHAAYGLSGTTRRIVLGSSGVHEAVAISAGALTLNALVGDAPIPDAMVHFSIYVAVGTDPEGRLIADQVKQGTVVRLPVGTYRIVSTYGENNAISSADLSVEPAKLIKATLRHRAATVTLKLVNNLGGEAYAGTAFSVLTPGGDTIRDLVGAFPSLILAEGDYILVARNSGHVFTSEFKVRSGIDQDIEVLARTSP